MDANVLRHWQNLCDRYYQTGPAALLPAERTWFYVRGLIDHTNNGGVISYFYNSGADHLDACMDSLATLGAHEVMQHLNRLAALFPAATMSDANARNDVIVSWPEGGAECALEEEVDEAIAPLLDDLEERLTEHLRDHGLLG